jgi:hypothetical protein
MHLPFWVRGPATGVGVLLLKIPFQIIGSKLLWWTWHINDPIFADKIYGVPWTEIGKNESYLIHAIINVL